ncbi:MAG: hypothetical protein EPN93_16720 [Spirochaetes bacterium]|nr:MAG: hypothetical protein EPN93_16720 [Spirochaetota bacterium]
MPEPAGSNKEIIAIKVRFNLTRQSFSGLLVAYFDLYKINLLAHFSLIIEGEDLASTSLAMPHDQLVEAIKNGATRYPVAGEMNSKVKSRLNSSVTKTYMETLLNHIKSKDIGSAENMIKRTIEAVLSTDRIESVLEFELLNYGEFAQLSVDERSEKLTMSDKIRIVMPYAENQAELAEKIIRENIQDIVLVRVSFLAESDVYGSVLITCGAVNGKIHGLLLAAGSDRGLADIDVSLSLIDYYSGMLGLLAHPKLDKTISPKIDALLRKIDSGIMLEAISRTDTVGVVTIVSDLLKTLTGRGASVQARCEKINSLKMTLLLNQDKEKKEEKAPAPKDDVVSGLRVVDASLIVSPGKGKSISSLKSGDWVQVLLNPANPLSMKILKSLNLIEGNKPKPIGTKVHTIKRTPKIGYTIYVQVAEGVLGKTIEEQDVRVKTGDPVVEQAEEKSSGSLLIGLIAGIVVLTVVLIVLALKK